MVFPNGTARRDPESVQLQEIDLMVASRSPGLQLSQTRLDMFQMRSVASTLMLHRYSPRGSKETNTTSPWWPVSEKTLDYARTVADKLTAAGVRVVLDESNEKIGYKIREAQQVDRVPYMLVLGAKEAEAGNISVRDRKGETTTQELDAFINNVVTEIKERRYN